MAFVFQAGDEAGFQPGTSILGGDVELPQLVIKQAELDHNIAAMRAYCAARNVSIAPHAKTTMAPAIISRQLAAGAWGSTVATMSQLRVCLDLGAPRVLLAYELVSPAAAQWLGTELAARPGQQVYCIADSVACADALAAGWRASGSRATLPVLVEVGLAGGRTGCRTPAQAQAVARAVAGHAELTLTGVEGFEGILGVGRSAVDLGKVDAFLATMVELAEWLDHHGLLAAAPEIVLTAGGSVYFDRVAEILVTARLSQPHQVVIRSGGYVTHDHGPSAADRPLVGADGATALIPALELWCEVTSVPEPGMAIAGFGKRAAPYDSGLPVVLTRLPAGQDQARPCTGVTVTAMNDQHAYLAVAAADLAVGDRLGCGIIHPCTAFDKWRRLPLVDAGYRVLETVDTFF